MFAWGDNQYGELALNNTTQYSSPKQIPGTTWSQVGGTIATRTDGTLWSWGYNYYGALGLNEGPSDMKSSPTQIGTDTTWNRLSMSGSNAGATKTDGTLWAWGANNDGQLGQNDKTKLSSPTQIPGTTWTKESFFL